MIRSLSKHELYARSLQYLLIKNPLFGQLIRRKMITDTRIKIHFNDSIVVILAFDIGCVPVYSIDFKFIGYSAGLANLSWICEVPPLG